MADACLFIGWDRPVAGREREAHAHLMGPSLEQLDTFQRAGAFESYQAIGLTPHCGHMNGCVLLFGDRAKLDELRRSDAFERFSIQLATLLEGYGVVPGVTLQGLKKVRDRNPQMF